MSLFLWSTHLSYVVFDNLNDPSCQRQRMAHLSGEYPLSSWQLRFRCFFQHSGLTHTSSAALWPPRFHISSSISICPLSYIYVQLCSVVWQGCHQNIIIKYLVVSLVFSCKATWDHFFQSCTFFPTFFGLFIFLWFWEVVAESLMICVRLLNPPLITPLCSSASKGIGTDKRKGFLH